MIAKRRNLRANDKYIVGTFAWAMDQAKSGRDMHRRTWPTSKHYTSGDAMKFTAEDKKALDWQAYIAVPLPVDQPDVYPIDDASDPDSNGWFGWCLVILGVAAIIAGTLYINGQLHY